MPRSRRARAAGPSRHLIAHHSRVERNAPGRRRSSVPSSAAFSQAVEENTGRKVIAFMSQVHFDPDMAAEIFVLEPADGENGNGAG